VEEREPILSATWVIVVFAVTGACGAGAQGTFQNLDFENANPVPNYTKFPFYIGYTAASCFPNWTPEVGGVVQMTILEEGFSTGAAEVTLLAPYPQQPPLDGNYSVLLEGNPIDSASISQTGWIPSGAQSLLFDAEPGLGPLSITVGNDSLTLFPVRAETGFEIYGANISAWAGQKEQLTFTASAYSISLNDWEIDDISFSPYPITVTPEPDTFVLMGIGGALFAGYRRFVPKRK
jgi:hypothetical protein